MKSHKKQDIGEVVKKFGKVFEDFLEKTVELFDTDPFTLMTAVVDYLNTVDPREDNYEWTISDIKFPNLKGDD